jgi:hypothetical protein
MDFSTCACHKHHSGERIGALSAYHFTFATPQRFVRAFETGDQ